MSDADDFQKLLDAFPDEELDPSLQLYMEDVPVLGKVIKHPLVFAVPYFPLENHRLNKMLEYKKQALKEAEDKENWPKFVFLHERPYRFDAFDSIESNLDDETYWSLLRDVWIDTENAHQNLEVWKFLWDSDRPQKEEVMDEEERDFLAALPDEITIYRGFVHDESVFGLSWTLDEEKAKWFARRFYHDEHEGNPRVAMTKVKKSQVHAFLNGRGEKEIVVDSETFIYPIETELVSKGKT